MTPQRIFLTSEQIARRAAYKRELRRRQLRTLLHMGAFALLLVMGWALVILAHCLGGPH